MSMREKSRKMKVYRKHREMYTGVKLLPCKLVKIYRSRWSTERYIYSGKRYIYREHCKERRVGEIYIYTREKEYFGHIDSE